MLTLRCCSTVAVVLNGRSNAFTLRMLNSSAVTPESQIQASETSFQFIYVAIVTFRRQHDARRTAMTPFPPGKCHDALLII